MVTPRLDQHLGLGEAVEDLAGEQPVTQRSIEALIIAIFPRRSRCDVEGLNSDPGEPLLDGGRDKPVA